MRVIAAAAEEPLREAVLGAIRPYRTADAGYRLENTFRYLVTRS